MSEDRADERPSPTSREPRGTLSRLVFRMASQLLGGAVETTAEPEGWDEAQQDTFVPEPAPAQPAVDAAQVLAEARAGFQLMLERLDQLEQQVGRQPLAAEDTAASQELEDQKRTLGEAFERTGNILRQLGVYVERLSEEAAGLRLVESRLEDRLDELTGMLREARLPLDREPAPGPVAPEEPRFWPDDHAVGIVLAAVPGFQGLMDAQRALDGLPAAEGASVVGYKNGEASLEVTLREPVSARQIVEGLRVATGHQFLIEEARPEAQRLRLRFVDGEGRG